MKLLPLFAIFTGLQLIRYFLFAGAAYLIIWKWKKPWAQAHRIQNRDFSAKDLRREISYSALSSLIIGAILTVTFHDHLTPDFRVMPLEVPTSGLYDALSLLGLILIHDTYFYWMHRLVHHPKLFSAVHRVHHLSTNPSPMAALSFHPAEAVLEVIWVWPVHAVTTIQPYIWLIFPLVMMLINVIGHLGVDIYPKSWLRHPLLKWLNFPSMHNLHHRKFEGNYGLYFSFWDRVMGTLK